ncbi:zinc transporter 10 [Pristis pectinata]|uniref:zinc transporter 10 n=1 Tax=Pristis pectinata TaxID=685728 RepID=UPI00223E645A|nr:zinc transporter 10 [Pristis pectinata]
MVKNCRMIFMLVITSGFFVVELLAGYMGNSISLVSDSFNMLSDMISLGIGLTAANVSRIKRRHSNTYGFVRAEVVGALANAVFLSALTFTVFAEAIVRLVHPFKIEDVGLVLIVGALGLAVNIVGLILFQNCCFRRKGSTRAGSLATGTREQTENKGSTNATTLNIRGVFLQVMGDALGSVVVVVSATIFYVLPLDKDEPCNWECYVDPSLTIIMVIIILSSVFPLVKETAVILLQMVPKGIELQDIDEKLHRVDGVHGIHELHIWELAGGKNIASLHVKCLDPSTYKTAGLQIREIFHNAGVHSVTIQVEFSERVNDSDLTCDFPCMLTECENKLCCIPQKYYDLDVEGYIEMSSNPPGASCNGHMRNMVEENNVKETSNIPFHNLATARKVSEEKEDTNGLLRLHSTSL